MSGHFERWLSARSVLALGLLGCLFCLLAQLPTSPLTAGAPPGLESEDCARAGRSYELWNRIEPRKEGCPQQT